MARQLKLSYIIEATEGASAQVLDRIGSKLDAIGHSYAGLAAMVGGGLEIKASIDEDSYFRQLAALTDTSFEKLNRIKAHIHDVAIDTKINIDEMVHGMAAFRTGGGDFDTFDKSATGAANAIAVLGGEGEEVGRVMAALDRSFDLKGPQKLKQGLALVVTELGSVNADFNSFARSFPDLAERAAAMGQTGIAAARDLVAVYGTLATTARSPRQAFGAVNSIYEIMETEHGRLGFQAKTGIAMQDGQGRALPLPQIVAAIARAAQNRGQRYLLEEALPEDAIAAIQKFITPEGQKTLKEMLAKGQTSPDLEKLEKALGVHAGEARSGIGGSMTKVKGELERDSDWVVEHVFTPLAPALAAVSQEGAGLIAVLGGVGMAGGLVSGIKMLGDALGFVGEKVPAATAAAEAAGKAGRTGGAAGIGAMVGLGIADALVAESPRIIRTLSEDMDDALGLSKPDHYDYLPGGVLGAPFPYPRRNGDWIDRAGRWIDHKLGLDHPDHPGVRGPQAPLSPYAVPPGGIPGAGATRGIRNNNPLNLEYHSGQGAIGTDGRFGVFDTLEHGLAAEYRQLLRYADRGLDTVDKIVHRWAPASENDDAAYERDVLKGSKIGANDRLNLRDSATASWLLAAMARHESGARLDPSVTRRAIGDVQGTKVGGEITVRVETADGTKARVTSMKSSNPDVPLVYTMGVGMVAP